MPIYDVEFRWEERGTIRIKADSKREALVYVERDLSTDMIGEYIVDKNLVVIGADENEDSFDADLDISTGDEA